MLYKFVRNSVWLCVAALHFSVDNGAIALSPSFDRRSMLLQTVLIAGTAVDPDALNEPAEVSELYDMVSRRRNSDYSELERTQIDALINQISSSKAATVWQPRLLSAKWRLAYLRPGPNGAGIDRRKRASPNLQFARACSRWW